MTGYTEFIECNKLRRKAYKLSRKLERANVQCTEEALRLLVQIRDAQDDAQVISLFRELIPILNDLLLIRDPMKVN